MSDRALTSLWFPFASPRPAASARLLCLPCAGGGATMYRDWPQRLPSLEVLALQLPGREHRIREAPLRDRGALLTAVRAALAALPPGPPLVLFGHSLGAQLAFELARELCRDGAPPLHLFAAGARAPHLAPRRILHDLPLPQLLDELVRMGGTSPRVVAEPELVALIEPMLRADLRLAETSVLPAAPLLPVPITAFGGSEDVQVAAADVAAWRLVAGAGCTVEFVRGGHFFVREQAADVCARIEVALAP